MRTLKRKRLKAGLTQKELASRAGIRTETLCRVECGKQKASKQLIILLRMILDGATT
jgi:transcriptional regulator with XRE-family HTH domain